MYWGLRNTIKLFLKWSHVFMSCYYANENRNYTKMPFLFLKERCYLHRPINILLITVSRLGTKCRKRLAIAPSWKNVPHTLFMQISSAISGGQTPYFPKTLQCFPTTVSLHFFVSPCRLVTESSGCTLHTRLAFL